MVCYTAVSQTKKMRMPGKPYACINGLGILFVLRPALRKHPYLATQFTVRVANSVTGGTEATLRKSNQNVPIDAVFRKVRPLLAEKSAQANLMCKTWGFIFWFTHKACTSSILKGASGLIPQTAGYEGAQFHKISRLGGRFFFVRADISLTDFCIASC